MGTPAEMMRQLRKNSISNRAFAKLSAEEQAANQKIVRGVLHTNDRVEYTRLYDQVIEKAGGRQDEHG
jgi:hypothetical protein